MKMKLMVGLLASVLIITGCSSKKKEESTPDTEDPVAQEGTNATTEPKTNKELTEKVKKEEGVTDGQVFEQDGKAIGSITVDKDVSDVEAQALAKHYVKEIKESYKELPVNVEVIRDNKTIANESLNAKDPVPKNNTQDKTGDHAKKDAEVDQTPQSVTSVKGKVVADPILMTFVARISAENVPNATPNDVLLLTVEGETYEMAYDAERKIYQNGIIQAENKESVLNAMFTIQKSS